MMWGCKCEEIKEDQVHELNHLNSRLYRLEEQMGELWTQLYKKTKDVFNAQALVEKMNEHELKEVVIKTLKNEASQIIDLINKEQPNANQ